MSKKVEDLVSGFSAAYQENPGDGVFVGTRLQQYIVFSGKAREYTEEELVEAARELGVPETQIGQFMDSLSSWL